MSELERAATAMIPSAMTGNDPNSFKPSSSTTNMHVDQANYIIVDGDDRTPNSGNYHDVRREETCGGPAPAARAAPTPRPSAVQGSSADRMNAPSSVQNAYFPGHMQNYPTAGSGHSFSFRNYQVVRRDESAGLGTEYVSIPYTAQVSTASLQYQSGTVVSHNTPKKIKDMPLHVPPTSASQKVNMPDDAQKNFLREIRDQVLNMGGDIDDVSKIGNILFDGKAEVKFSCPLTIKSFVKEGRMQAPLVQECLFPGPYLAIKERVLVHYCQDMENKLAEKEKVQIYNKFKFF